MSLSEEQLAIFEREGLLCIPEFLAPSEVSALLSKAQELLNNFDMSHHPLTKFTTGENNHVGDQYFFDSSDKISYFFDTDAFNSKGELIRPKESSINKIGHGLHMKDELFHRISFDKKVKEIARSLRFKDPRILQSMCIFKQPATAGCSDTRDNAVPSHTDGVFLYTNPQSAIGFWYALEDCTIENGCLAYNPGSHKLFPITKRFVKVDGGKKGTNFIPVEYDTTKPIPDDKPEDYQLVECKAGSLVLIHNSVLHKSERNSSQKSRFAYAFHIIEGEADYDALNWLQVPPSPEGGSDFSRLYDE